MELIAETERIDLLRGGSLVSSLAGAFGNALRETRLTAMLGYLIAMAPCNFCDIFGFRGKPLSVSLEMNHAADRSDNFIKTTRGSGLIEAKTDAIDPFRQSLKYQAKWRILLTEHAASSKQTRRHGVKYFRWRDLEKLLRQLAQSRDYSIRFVSGDLLRYLEKHNMVKKRQSVEIYAREIINRTTLELFLKAQMYLCKYEQSSRLTEALYFAPHFGQRIAHECLGVQAGISYIARVERIEVVDTEKDLLRATREVRGDAWLKARRPVINPLSSDRKLDGTKHSVLFFSTPRLVFNPPVLKNKLQKGSGWLSKRSFTFDELFQAWGAGCGL